MIALISEQNKGVCATMSEYKKPYLHLFNRVSQMIEDLQRAQLECEELFMDEDSEETAEKSDENSGDA